jgi:hypothetical protein
LENIQLLRDWQFTIAALISLLIPIGAIVPLSESITKPLMALSAGVILCVVGSSEQ